MRRILDAFTTEHGWKPNMTASFAGALKYTQYNWLKRALIKHIAKKEGGSTDTSQDHEYTDWTRSTRSRNASSPSCERAQENR